MIETRKNNWLNARQPLRLLACGIGHKADRFAGLCAQGTFSLSAVRDGQLGEDAHRYANRISAPVFPFLKTEVMNLLRRGGYRLIRQGYRELAYYIKEMMALAEMIPVGART